MKKWKDGMVDVCGNPKPGGRIRQNAGDWRASRSSGQSWLSADCVSLRSYFFAACAGKS